MLLNVTQTKYNIIHINKTKIDQFDFGKVEKRLLISSKKKPTFKLHKKKNKLYIYI